MKTNTAGADWKGDGELKALHRIIKPIIADDEPEEALPPAGHNRPPSDRVFELSRLQIELEQKEQSFERLLKQTNEAERRYNDFVQRAGAALIDLKRLWNAVIAEQYAARVRKVGELFQAGKTKTEISNALKLNRNTVDHDLKMLAASKEYTPRMKNVKFSSWAAKRFGCSESAIDRYLFVARHPADAAARQRREIHAQNALMKHARVIANLLRRSVIESANTAIAIYCQSDADADLLLQCFRTLAAKRDQQGYPDMPG